MGSIVLEKYRLLVENGIMQPIKYDNTYGFPYGARIIYEEPSLSYIRRNISEKEIKGGIIEVSIYMKDNVIYYEIVSIFYVKNGSDSPILEYEKGGDIPSSTITNHMGRSNFKFDFIHYTIDQNVDCETFFNSNLDHSGFMQPDYPNTYYYLFRVAIISNHNETLIAFYSEPNKTSLIKI